MNKEQLEICPEDRYGSVTIDFIRSLPNLDVDMNRNHLLAALYALGFDLTKKVDSITDVLVRYRHSPMHVRKTTIFQGQLRKDYPYKAIFKGHDVLDVNAKNPKSYNEFNVVVDMLQAESKQLVTDLPFDIPDYVGTNDGDKQYNRSPEEKQRYKVMNMHDKSLSDLIKEEELFQSPFDK
jgi:hypothetical protein